jgi:hypothetical protein
MADGRSHLVTSNKIVSLKLTAEFLAEPIKPLPVNSNAPVRVLPDATVAASLPHNDKIPASIHRDIGSELCAGRRRVDLKTGRRRDSVRVKHAGGKSEAVAVRSSTLTRRDNDECPRRIGSDCGFKVDRRGRDGQCLDADRLDR